MIAECKAGKIDLVITKSVSRFARNVVDFLGMVHCGQRSVFEGVFGADAASADIGLRLQ